MASYAPVPPAPPVYAAVDEPHKPYNPPLQSFHIDTHNLDYRQSQGSTLPPRTKGSRSFKHAFSNLWLFEFFCWLVTLACFAGIIAVLVSFDGQPVPNWKWGITLPTVVSLISSVATFSLAVPIDEGLGQLKWLWFRKTRPLSDFETIDDAAGGPSGSAMLILKFKGGPLAFSGALLTILLLAISPFVQQVLSTELQAVPKNEASLPIAHTYLNDTNTVDVDLSMKAAIMNGLLSFGEASPYLFEVPAQCPTGNCTWPNYKSLSVCSQCADLTKRLQTQPANSSTNYSLPNGVSLIQDPIAIGVSMTVNNTLANASLTSIAFKDRLNDSMPLADVFVILANYTWDGLGDTPDKLNLGPYAAECILELCVQEYSAISKNGTFHETPVGRPMHLDAGANRDVVDMGTHSLAYYYVTQDGKNYTIGESAMKGFWFYFTTLFTGSVAQYNSASAQPEWPSDLTQSIFQHLNATPHTLDAMFANIAASATLNLRTRPDAEIWRGDALYQQAIVTVRWLWMILPLALLILTLVFLLSVAVQTRLAGMQTWKTSSVAQLFALQGLRDKKEMEAVAERMYVKMGRDGRGEWVLQSRM
ncbi:hypothetical protein PRZ48_013782 [Zasmidium cellare]|uniref:DUF3176 domain containing protein n=1 Tax=Zasmidium cellare TaxID=395010 RepID=A0ABR0E201_ZASCE|nr:hypothetical protein PRZ48_013782 [Zasmidium cellare]